MEIDIHNIIRESITNNINMLCNQYNGGNNGINSINTINTINTSNLISRRYFNSPPVGGYQINEDEEYIFHNNIINDDLSPMVFIDLVNVVRNIELNNQNNEPSDNTILKKNIIKLKCPYKKIKINDPILTNQCSICIEHFKIGEFKRTLNCKHCFHKKCIDRWIKKDKNECPMCRSDII